MSIVLGYDLLRVSSLAWSGFVVWRGQGVYFGVVRICSLGWPVVMQGNIGWSESVVWGQQSV